MADNGFLTDKLLTKTKCIMDNIYQRVSKQVENMHLKLNCIILPHKNRRVLIFCGFIFLVNMYPLLKP